VHRALADKIIALNIASGNDPKMAEDEMRQKYEKLDVKYRNQFVREVISQKGTEEVGTRMRVSCILLQFPVIFVTYYRFLQKS